MTFLNMYNRVSLSSVPESQSSCILFATALGVGLELRPLPSTVKEKYPGSSFLMFHACNGQHGWLILPFGFKSNLFKLLYIEVIFIYNISILD